MQQPFKPTAENIKTASAEFVEQGLKTFRIGSPYYFATLALSGAIEALSEGNYGVGASALVVRDDTYYVFTQRNAMNTGIGVVDHAETRLMMDVRRFVLEELDKRKLDASEAARSELRQPHSVGLVDDLAVPATDLNATNYMIETAPNTLRFGDGIYVFSNLEPCPMCMETIFNAGGLASITSSPDPFAADVISNPDSRPALWRLMAQQRGLTYTLLDTPLEDTASRLTEYQNFKDQVNSGAITPQLRADDRTHTRLSLMYLSEHIFLTTREAIDAALTARA